MKIIEALKQVKHLQKRNSDTVDRIVKHSANMQMDTTGYADLKAQVLEWVQSVSDTNREIERLMRCITITNATLTMTLVIGKHTITKTISEWLTRRDVTWEFDNRAWGLMTNKNLKPALIKVTGSEEQVMNAVILNYDPAKRDEMLALLAEERTAIMSALEIFNATNDLIEE